METVIASLLPGMILFWAGFVSSISFMETWLKFRVQGVTLPMGLSIGKKIFSAMNQMEWIFIIIYIILQALHHKIGNGTIVLLSVLLFLILAVQTFLLLPRLHKRVDLIVGGKDVPHSSVHMYYVILELIKVISLVVLGYLLIGIQLNHFLKQ
jgi:hypothetical protein